MGKKVKAHRYCTVLSGSEMDKQSQSVCPGSRPPKVKRLHRLGNYQTEFVRAGRRHDVLGASSPSANQGHCSQLSNVSLVSRSPPPPPPTLLFDHQTVSFLSRRIGLFLSLVAMIQPATLVLATGVNSERHE